MPVRGIDRVRKGFRVITDDISQKKTEAAVHSILSQGAALSQTMVPVDSGNLINSQYSPQINVKTGMVRGTVGYTASYAKSVHQASGKLKGQPRADFGKTSNHSDAGPQMPQSFGGGTGVGDYWDPNAEPEFMKKGFEQLAPSIPAILGRFYRV